MATDKVHLLSEVQPNWGYPKWYHFIHCGECTEKPEYKGLWYVTIPPGQYKFAEGHETHWPAEEHTFLVTKEYATSYYFELWRRDVEQWSAVAQQVIVGSWCAKYECLWSERPTFDLTLANGVQVKYGLCRAQPENNHRELWFVALNVDGGHTFLVDQLCAQPEVITILGDDWRNGWMSICWCHLTSEVRWESIGTPDDSTASATWQLDSPFTPDSVEDALSKVEVYRQIGLPKEEPKRRRRWFF